MKANFETFMSLDHENDSVALYKQIYDSIRGSILRGEIESQTQLPSSRALAEQLGVSRMTVVNAYDQLLAEGYLEGKAGSGTFVASRLPEDYLIAPKENIENRREHKRRLRLSEYGKFLVRNGRAIQSNEAAGQRAPFQHGLPALDDFPHHLWQKLIQKSQQTPLKRLLDENEPTGYRPLRDAIAGHLRAARGVNCAPEEVVITNGAQQGLDLISRILLGAGDHVWIEDPGYLGAREAFGASGADVLPVKCDAEGFDLDRAEKKYGSADLVYVTPSHQFPLGGAMSLRRRLKLLEWAANSNAWIVEDDYDSEFRYEGRPLASMQGLDRDGRVIYVGTFSKTLFSSLRLGCLVVPPDMIEIFSTARIVTDAHSPLIEQAALAEFIRDGHFVRHVRRMRKLYAERQHILFEAAGKYLKGIMELEHASSGMHLVGWLPDGISDIEFSAAAAKKGVRLAPVSDYAIRKPRRCGVLLGYAAFNKMQIVDAVKKIAEIRVGSR